MSLLSLTQTADGSEDEDKDDIIVTLAIPGHDTKTSVCCEPIVITSDSEEDSDSDITVLSELSSLPPLDSSSSARTNTFSKVLDIPPSDDDCFVSEFHCATKPSASVDHSLSHSVYTGRKDIFESSEGSPDVVISDPFVQGKDVFLSDSSGDYDVDSLCASSDVSDKHMRSSTVGAASLLLSSADHDMSAIKDVKIDKPKSVSLSQKASSDNVVLSPGVSSCADTSLMKSPVLSDISHCKVPASGSGRKTARRRPSSVGRQTQVRRSRRRSNAGLLSSDRSAACSSQSAACTGRQWTVQSKGDFKVLLRRSVSAGDSSDQQSPHKRRCHVFFSPATNSVFYPAADSLSAKPDLAADSVTELSVCYGCRRSVPAHQLSYCMAGHGCCGQCLQTQVKTLLASGKKVIYYLNVLAME